MRCPNCGKQNDDNLEFCTDCGGRLDAPDGEAEPASEPVSVSTTVEAAEEVVTETAAEAAETVAESEAAAPEAPAALEAAAPVTPAAPMSPASPYGNTPMYTAPDPANNMRQDQPIYQQPPQYDQPRMNGRNAAYPNPASARRQQAVPAQQAAPAPQATPAYTPAAQQEPVRRKRAMAPCKPLSTWSYIWRGVLFSIPIIGLVLLFVFAFAQGINENSRSFARAWLIKLLVGLIVVIALVIVGYIMRNSLISWLGEAIRNFLNLPAA